MDYEKIYFQEENQAYIKTKLGSERMIPIYAKEIKDGYDKLYWSALVKNENIKDIIEKNSWDLDIGSGFPGFTIYGQQEDGIYSRFNRDDGVEPIVYVRDFHGLKDNYVEIIEEFRLLNNLYYDNQKKEYINLEEGEETVIQIKNETYVYINLKYLKRFLAVKNMSLVIYFDMIYTEPGKLSEIGIDNDNSITYVEDSIKYDIYIGENNLIGENKRISRLNGKKIIKGMNIQLCGYWPYDTKEKYESFVIGQDENGEEVEFSCNPNYLSNYFGANEGNPHYLTPVFFTKDVLTKYYSKPERYDVGDNILHCGNLWSLKIDNQHKEVVSVYLGDLGSSLTHKEQLYWKSFNIVSDIGISDTRFTRDFLASFTDPISIDLLFKQRFNMFNTKWKNKFGWNLFLPLSENDQYNFEHIRIPVSNSISEFDTLVLSLVKTIIDSLNEKEIRKQLKGDYGDIKGIAKLENWMIENNIRDYKEHIDFLKNLQTLRSTSVGHRKGKNYEKVSKTFDIGSKTYSDVFEEILKESIKFIDFIDLVFLS